MYKKTVLLSLLVCGLSQQVYANNSSFTPYCSSLLDKISHIPGQSWQVNDPTLHIVTQDIQSPLTALPQNCDVQEGLNNDKSQILCTYNHGTLALTTTETSSSFLSNPWTAVVGGTTISALAGPATIIIAHIIHVIL